MYYDNKYNSIYNKYQINNINLHNLALQVVTSSWLSNLSKNINLCGRKRREVTETRSSCLLCHQQTVEWENMIKNHIVFFILKVSKGTIFNFNFIFI